MALTGASDRGSEAASPQEGTDSLHELTGSSCLRRQLKYYMDTYSHLFTWRKHPVRNSRTVRYRFRYLSSLGYKRQRLGRAVRDMLCLDNDSFESFMCLLHMYLRVRPEVRVALRSALKPIVPLHRGGTHNTPQLLGRSNAVRKQRRRAFENKEKAEANPFVGLFSRPEEPNRSPSPPPDRRRDGMFLSRDWPLADQSYLDLSKETEKSLSPFGELFTKESGLCKKCTSHGGPIDREEYDARRARNAPVCCVHTTEGPIPCSCCLCISDRTGSKKPGFNYQQHQHLMSSRHGGYEDNSSSKGLEISSLLDNLF
jgi:hypothetical protein